MLTIPSLSKRFNVLSGISDHTKGTVAAIASVSLGGNIIEKHIKLNDGEKTVDSFFSLSENEFIFHAGTKNNQLKILSNGGRVLNFVVTSEDFKISRIKVINLINQLDWSNGFFRKDIGYKVIN